MRRLAESLEDWVCSWLALQCDIFIMSCRKKVDFVDVFYKISLDFSLDISLDF